jgi:hypothetical protein
MTPPKKCFVIMPFGKRGTPEHIHNKKIYEIMIKPVVKACGYDPIRSDELLHPGSITRGIIELLFSSHLVVADLSGKNANVFYELGVRHTLFRCGTIPIVCDGEELPFDIKDYRAIYYSSELDGPDEFKKELELRIKAFDNMEKDKSDNPVYDALGDSLQFQNPAEYVSRKSFDEKQRKLAALTNQLDALQEQNKQLLLKQKSSEEQIKASESERTSLLRKIAKLEQEFQLAKQSVAPRVEKKATVTKSKPFRSEPQTLSYDDVKAMLKKFNFFDSSWNKDASGFANQYKAETIKGDKVVFDEASGLMWQQGGSPERMEYEPAKNLIADLNKKGFAGYHDWCLPTLEEAMSLMEPKKNKNDLYIDPIFDSQQSWIWTCDPIQGGSWAWVVYFDGGRCYDGQFDFYYYVRAVRFGQSSP